VSGAAATSRPGGTWPERCTRPLRVRRHFVNAPTRGPGPLSPHLDAALHAGDGALEALMGAEPVDRRDLVLSLLTVHDVHLAPIDRLGPKVRWQHHPALAALKYRLETAYLADLEAADAATHWDLPGDAVGAMRALSRVELVPEIYRWVAEEADIDELVEFLALEGGPDAGFDDLVAVCQLGLAGEAKVELARNYWDEMGNGSLDAVHRELHDRLVTALDVPAVPRAEQPLEVLERAVLGPLLATNRRLQPEMVGALGLLELQAGPRCRKVVEGLRRLRAPEEAFPFYVEHAVADPRHGKDWVDNVVAPLAAAPCWAEGIIRGARWRSLLNARFFDAMVRRFACVEVGRRRRKAS
jgi:hypothetical protein